MEVDYSWGTSVTNAVSVQKLKQHFRDKFLSTPHYYVKVPGRVNLIGEHVDYCGYSVFPMAIEQCIVVAVNRTNNRQIVELTNLKSERYEDVSKNVSEISEEWLGKSLSWSNYFFCGILGAREYLSESQLKSVENIGFQFAVTGNIPESSGLSSSSALVTAAVMATLLGYGIQLSRLQLAEISANCEKYIGTAGGGMDQAIAVNAQEGFASRIDFNPLAIKHFHLPCTVKFVVAQSLAIKNKAASNDFNTRVVECRLASQIIAKRLNLEWQKLTILASLQKRSCNTLDQMIKLVHQNLHIEPYTKKEEFCLHQRALHVFEEAKRMEKFCQLCENSGTPTELGQLMNESHSSLRDLYQCSHPDLEELVELCHQGGAFGCKLTGAGWGGCVVVMVPSDGADKFVKFVKEHFYSKRANDGKNIEQLIFTTSPSEGACLYNLMPQIFDSNIGDLPKIAQLI